MDSNQHAGTRRGLAMRQEPVEEFRPTGGRVQGVIAVTAAAGLVAIGLRDLDSGFPAPLVAACLLLGLLAWASMLRPRVWATADDLVMRNMLHTVWIPLAAIQTVVVRQVLAVGVGEGRYVSPAIGQSARATARADQAGARKSATESYQVFVEQRIGQLADTARSELGVEKHSEEQAALAEGVRRSWAWPEIVALGAGVIVLVLTLVR
jgi:hypothetical protein